MGVITTHYPLITHSNAVFSTSGGPMFITPGAENCKNKKILSIMGHNYFL